MRQMFLFCAHRMGGTEALFLPHIGGYVLAPMIVFVTRGDCDWRAQSVLRTRRLRCRRLYDCCPAAPVASPPHPRPRRAQARCRSK